jgi:hypothetical protein
VLVEDDRRYRLPNSATALSRSRQKKIAV